MLLLPAALQATLAVILLSSSLVAAAPPLFRDQSTQSTSTPFLASSTDRVLRFSWPDQASQERAFSQASHRLDVWRRTKTSLDIRLGPDDRLPEDSLWSDDVIKVETVVPSLDDLLELPEISTKGNLARSEAAVADFAAAPSHLRMRPDAATDPIHLTYHPYGSLVTIMETFVKDFPGYAKLVSFGNSSEGREIWGLQVGNFSHKLPMDDVEVGQEEEEGEEEDLKAKKPNKKRPRKGISRKLGVVVLGTQHAREWVAASTSLYFIHSLLLSTLPDARHGHSLSTLLKSITFTIVPVVNVDGYVYTWTDDRLWRKNRQEVDSKKGCVGLDLNRNWGFQWTPGARPNPCSDAYPGSKAFQAPELAALRDFLLEPKNNIVSFNDLHSFGQMLLFPYSYSCSKSTSDAEDLFEAVVGAAKALRSVHGRSFETGSVCEVSLSGPGDAIDWSYAIGKITWSFTFELRDLGIFGFLLPASQIVPSGQETTAALASLARFVLVKERLGKRISSEV